MTDSEAEITMSEAEVCEIARISADELSEYPLFPEYKRALDYYFANQG